MLMQSCTTGVGSGIVILMELLQLIQGIAGLGIVGATTAYIYRVIEGKSQRQREKKGLLRMLLVEIEENERVLRGFTARPAFIVNAPAGYLRWSVWADVRARLSQLIEDEDKLGDLARCYNMVEQIEAFRLIGEDKLNQQDVIDQIDSKLSDARDRCQVAAQHIGSHLPEAAGSRLPPSDKRALGSEE
jgi:hypothetical protein